MAKKKKRKNKGIDMKSRVDKLVRRMDYSRGESFLMFLDTGAIIDCEEEVKRWKLSDSRGAVKKVYENLKKYGNIAPLVTENTLREVFKHHRDCFVNGRPEISKENFDIVQGFHNDYVNFLRSITGSGADGKKVEADILKAYGLAYEEGHKKKCRDPLSDHDLSLLVSAVCARYSQFYHDSFFGERYNKEIGREPDKVIVLSPDSHMGRILEVLTDRKLHIAEEHGKFGYDGIKAVTSRETS